MQVEYGIIGCKQRLYDSEVQGRIEMKNTTVINQLKELKGKQVLIHIRNDAIIDGILTLMFYPYADNSNPLHICVDGAGDTHAHVAIDDIKFISENEIVLDSE